MRGEQRLRRLEVAVQEYLVFREAQRIAAQYHVDVRDVLRDTKEIGARVERWGLGAELRRLARKSRRTEEEVRAYYEAACKKYELDG